MTRLSNAQILKMLQQAQEECRSGLHQPVFNYRTTWERIIGEKAALKRKHGPLVEKPIVIMPGHEARENKLAARALLEALIEAYEAKKRMQEYSQTIRTQVDSVLARRTRKADMVQAVSLVQKTLAGAGLVNTPISEKRTARGSENRAFVLYCENGQTEIVITKEMMESADPKAAVTEAVRSSLKTLDIDMKAANETLDPCLDGIPASPLKGRKIRFEGIFQLENAFTFTYLSDGMGSSFHIPVGKGEGKLCVDTLLLEIDKAIFEMHGQEGRPYDPEVIEEIISVRKEKSHMAGMSPAQIRVAKVLDFMLLGEYLYTIRSRGFDPDLLPKEYKDAILSLKGIPIPGPILVQSKELDELRGNIARLSGIKEMAADDPALQDIADAVSLIASNDPDVPGSPSAPEAGASTPHCEMLRIIDKALDSLVSEGTIRVESV